MAAAGGQAKSSLARSLTAHFRACRTRQYASAISPEDPVHTQKSFSDGSSTLVTPHKIQPHHHQDMLTPGGLQFPLLCQPHPPPPTRTAAVLPTPPTVPDGPNSPTVGPQAGRHQSRRLRRRTDMATGGVAAPLWCAYELPLFACCCDRSCGASALSSVICCTRQRAGRGRALATERPNATQSSIRAQPPAAKFPPSQQQSQTENRALTHRVIRTAEVLN